MRKWTEEDRKRQSALMRRLKPWKKSTGPRTKAGKEKSKYNAVKHGGRSAATIRMRKALAAQSAYLKAVKDTVKQGFPVCSMLKSTGRGVTNELLRACLNLCDPTPVLDDNIIKFAQQQAMNHHPPPDYRHAA